ncbi:HNH endonuclease [Patescibacteria group bacterium]|nr:HNH endonuclease [Patescibacteria group bacterium]
MRTRSWNIEQLKKAAEQSTSFCGVLRILKLRDAGGNYVQIKKYIQENLIDISHFKGRAWNKGLKGIYKRRIPLEKILVKNSNYQSFKLKKRLFDENIKKPYCEECNWDKKSENGYLPLELDHINGDCHDNRVENLRVLCPNCHSLKSTHRGRKNKKNTV